MLDWRGLDSVVADGSGGAAGMRRGGSVEGAVECLLLHQ